MGRLLEAPTGAEGAPGIRDTGTGFAGSAAAGAEDLAAVRVEDSVEDWAEGWAETEDGGRAAGARAGVGDGEGERFEAGERDEGGTVAAEA